MDLGATQLFTGVEDVSHVVRVLARLSVATLLGGAIGAERLRSGKAAGVRTHALVAVGAALFVLVALETGASPSDLSRVVQGVAAGIGFLGAGTILKLTEEHTIEGLTTAASIWLTAAAGMAIGAGWFWPAVIGIFFGWLILYAGHFVERMIRGQKG